VYENRFTCLPSSIPARPALRRDRVQQVVEVATVTGPAGEDIYTDEFGRIKVQFPWDRDGTHNETSSCWIRVSQAWAGAGWGSQFIPRVGMEVLVSFVGGDVDRPVVTGCLYNGIHPTAFALPDHKTRSGFRTQSTPGGDGFNELSFDDAAGSEQMQLHAARDLDVDVKRNHTIEVGGDEIRHVRRDLQDVVDGDRTTQTRGAATVIASGDHGVQIGGDRNDIIGGNDSLRVDKERSVRVGGRERRENGAESELFYRDDQTVRIQGCATTVVGRREAKRSYVLHVEGVAQIAGTTETEVTSEKAVVLRCGKSSLRLTPEAIEISAPTVRVVGRGAEISADAKLTVRAQSEALFVADKMLLKASRSSLALSKEAQVDGDKILLKSPNTSTDPVADPTPPPTTIEVVDARGKPLRRQRFCVTLPDGTTRNGVTGEDGTVDVTLDEAGTITFPDLIDTRKG
jgi:type VI secretion system secreted protein VgrG